HTATNAEDKNRFSRFEPCVCDQHSPDCDKYQRKSRRFPERKADRNRKTVLRRQLYILSVGAFQSFAEHAKAKAHEVAVHETKLTLAATRWRIEANRIADPDILDIATDVHNDSGAVRAENMRH